MTREIWRTKFKHQPIGFA